MSRRAPIVSDGIDLDDVDVAELLERTAKVSHGGHHCWAHSADGKLKEYLDGCRKRAKEGQPFSLRKALEVAQEYFGVKIEIAAFRNHVMSRCACKENER